MIVRRVYTTIWCDAARCNESFEDEGPIAHTLSTARALGWRRRSIDGSVHEYCPRHA